MKIPKDLQVGQKIEVVYITGEFETVVFGGWDWTYGLFPVLRFEDEYWEEEKLVKISGWIRRSLIARLKLIKTDQRSQKIKV
ncbi:hypothetical protein [Paenibacillus glycinis]|uniref:DUF5348 domain-containing protein n=1 Tax=Paenibacillus glycinis TaxID=2697035 RepID=A0ABW9XSI4_9BACL|nr:hypothetical protein [Paenibacillus glycinis]NBD25609.1 hypothetical protein [Paenibacillus glycinis]